MKILVIGGYGNFGKRLVASLLSHHDHEIIIAGRSPHRAAACREINQAGRKPVASIRLDLFDEMLEQRIGELQADIVINASGPFRQQPGRNPYPLASACAKAGSHYVDLADNREFVVEFAARLDRLARRNRVSLVTGASTVPGLTAAVLDHFAPRFARLEAVDYGISPGNRSERGLATVASILSYTGRPFDTLKDGRRQQVYGWQDLRRVDLGPPLNRRWLGNCDIPDLELIPRRFPGLESLRFQAGLEVTLLHVGLWLLSLSARAGIPENWARFARPLTRISGWFKSMGSDCGAMFVVMKGVDDDDAAREISWQLVAENGRGPNIPAISAELVVEKIAQGLCPAGAMPCMGLFTLSEFLSVAGRWGIYSRETAGV